MKWALWAWPVRGTGSTAFEVMLERVGLTHFYCGATGAAVLVRLDGMSPDGRHGHDERMITVH